MRVVYLAAGAAGMYCGSCLRDNRLATRLQRQGRAFTLVPLYTPIRTDEHDSSTGQVYFGGINVYLDEHMPMARKLPRGVKRVLDSPALISMATRLGGSTRAEDLGGLTISVLRGEHGPQQKELEILVEALLRMRPDVVHLATLLFLGMAGPIKEAIGAKIACTLSGEDVFIDALLDPYRTRALGLIEEGARHVDAFTAVTRYYGDHCVRHFRLPSDRVFTTRMGIDVEAFPERVEPSGVFTIGYFARICPEKGLMNLCRALVRLRDAGRDCRVVAAGYLGKGDRGYFRQVEDFVRAEGLADRFECVGEVDRQGKLQVLSRCHVLSVPTSYQEAKGLYILEALACGVPVVQPRHGSFPELVEATGGGLLYDPHDEAAHVEALSTLMDDAPLRSRLGRAGRQSVVERFNDRIMADETWALYERLMAGDRRSSS